MSADVVAVELRKITSTGDSLAVTLPKRTLEAEFNVDAEELQSQHVRLSLDSEGMLTANLPISQDGSEGVSEDR